MPHKTANILDALPKRLHRQAKAAIHEICQAETRAEANAGIDDFVRVPCCTLGAPATNEPDRVDLRNGKGKK